LSTPFQLVVPRAIYDQMIAQARSELPNECCGLLGGAIHHSPPTPHASLLPVGRVERHFPLVNSAASPTEYLSDPRSMFEAVRDMRRLGIDILAVYHSHPISAPVPSRTDLERSYSPEVVNLIISLKDGEPLIRAWWLSEKDFHETAWHIAE
jgi:proteasome lid subunit RPN8/RPN11